MTRLAPENSFREVPSPLILDGGMGHLLRRKGVQIAGPLGSLERFLGVALANRDAPEMVMDAHMEYLRAGADVITTNTYACIPAAIGDDELVRDLIQRGGYLAQRARTLSLEEDPRREHAPVVAGCLPPLHESYRPDRVGSEAEMTRVYGDIVENIAEYCDVLLCETMSSVAEARAAAGAADAAGIPVWVSWTVEEDASGRLRSGESMREAIDALAHLSNVEAYSVNCSAPDAIDAGLAALHDVCGDGVALGAYANGFSSAFLDSRFGAEYDDTLTPDLYATRAAAWCEIGAGIIGGCCGVFPEHIAAVSEKSASKRARS